MDQVLLEWLSGSDFAEVAMTLDQLANAFVTLLVIVEPVAVVPLFLGLTQGFDAAQRRQAASGPRSIANRTKCASSCVS